MARVTFDKNLLLVCAVVCVSPSQVWASADAPLPAATSFAYSISHPVRPLSDAVIAKTVNTDGHDSDDADAFDTPHDTRVDVRIGASRPMSRSGMCNAVVAVARANGLPIPFFANLIWQESNFDVKSISRAGALGVAQYMPETANEQGLINPFEPVHALHVAGKFLRRLHAQFGNLGLAAAAYNAGPGRISRWIANRGGLPGETRAYVARITGQKAEQWTSREFVRSPESTLMPARAPCVEVAEAVQEQGNIVRIAKLVSELATATRPPPRDNPNDKNFDESAWTIATAKPEWQQFAMSVAQGALRNIKEQTRLEASAKRVGKTASRAWAKVAGRTMRLAAEELTKADARSDKDKDHKAGMPERRSRRARVASSR
jgi:hypothetical protein